MCRSIQSLHRDKLGPRVVKCVFLGYYSTKKEYKCYHPSAKKHLVSRYIKFDETKLYFSKSSSSQGENLLDFFSLLNPSTKTYCTPSVSIC